jgi:PAS domain S-box-containing protein
LVYGGKDVIKSMVTCFSTRMEGAILQKDKKWKYGILLVDKNNEILALNYLAEEALHKCSVLNLNNILESQSLNEYFFIEEVKFGNPNSYIEGIKVYILIPLEEKDADFYRMILEASHDEIFVSDGKGVTLFCNKTFEKNYGMERSEIIGKTVWHLTNNGYCDHSPIPIVIQKKKEITIDQETATGRKLIITATPVINDSGEIEMIVENCRDITEIEKIKIKLEKTTRQMEMYKTEVESLKKRGMNFGDTLISKSKKMKAIVDLVHRISNIDCTILILGESGTGKTAMAQYIHRNSSRKNNPFITINCAAISPTLLESELFGYAPGAFTGAKKEGKIGLVELADGGTLFLDEIGEIPIDLQSKFLQLIQDHKFTPIGGVKAKTIDIRIISATNQNLAELVKKKIFREDLYYRLKVLDIEIPPLRERMEDIEALIYYFLEKYNEKYGLNHELSSECINIMLKYLWQGNIRELQHVIEQLVITASHKLIKEHDLPAYIYMDLSKDFKTNFDMSISLDAALGEVEKELITKAYNHFGSSYKVADALGISQSKANRLIRKYVELDK